MSDDEQTKVKWSELSADALLNGAQACLEQANTVFNVEFQMVLAQSALAMAQAAQVRAAQESATHLDFIIEHRLGDKISTAIWEGLRSR
jgi:hypothetical protein